MSKSRLEVTASVDGLQLHGTVYRDAHSERLEYCSEPTVSIGLDERFEPAAVLRDLFRVSRAIAEHRELLERVAAEDRSALDDVRAERDRIHREVRRFVPPSSGWVQGLARHRAMQTVTDLLEWRVTEAEATLREMMARRVVELVLDLEVLDVEALCTASFPDSISSWSVDGDSHEQA